MSEKKDKFNEEIERLENEIFRDRIKDALAENPGNYPESLEDLGFTWHDDGYPSEEEEEGAAKPENDHQRILVSYFEGETELSDPVLHALSVERNREEPNYPLIRKYFRAANPRLKILILFGLEKEPADFVLLTDLVFFNEFDRNLSELVEHFTRACRQVDDPEKFSEIAREFHYGKLADGYSALPALRDIFDESTDKRK
ncbi:MAG: hypothetical protein P1P81_09750 [Desulfobulbales bacterium]|nr:hypothetical protein [Desulfobulbales bacterium]